MPSSLAADGLQVRCGRLSSGAPQQPMGLVGSGPSCAGEHLQHGFRKKTCWEPGSSSADWKAFSRIGQSVNGRAPAAGLQVGMLWFPTPGEDLQLGC